MISWSIAAVLGNPVVVVRTRPRAILPDTLEPRFCVLKEIFYVKKDVHTTV